MLLSRLSLPLLVRPEERESRRSMCALVVVRISRVPPDMEAQATVQTC